MKICLICGAAYADDPPTCLACGEASWTRDVAREPERVDVGGDVDGSDDGDGDGEDTSDVAAEADAAPAPATELFPRRRKRGHR